MVKKFNKSMDFYYLIVYNNNCKKGRLKDYEKKVFC